MSDVQRDTDLDLLSAWRGGSPAAGNQLCRKFDSKLRRFFGTKVPPHEVDELVQQTWLAMAQASRGAVAEPVCLHIRTTFRAYLVGVARHIVLGYFRKNRRGGRFDPEIDSVEALVPSLSQQFLLQFKVKQLELALQSLPIELQLLIEARYVEELTGPELAEAFGLPEGTVRSRLAKARRLLNEALEKWERHPPSAAAGARNG